MVSSQTSLLTRANRESDFVVSRIGPRGGRFTLISCEACGNQFEVSWEFRHRRLCPAPASCRWDIQRKTKVVLTNEQRAINELLRRQRSATGRRGQTRTVEQRAKISAGTKRAWADGRLVGSPRSEQARAKISEKVLQAYRDGRLSPTACYRNKHALYGGPQGFIKMRSRSEVLFALHLDQEGIEWQYEPQRFDLGWSTYTPDFYLPALDRWIEVKGFWTDDSKRKFDEFSSVHRASVVYARDILKFAVVGSV